MAGNLVLASGSPRRASLLRQLGLSFEVIIPSVDESRQPDEPALPYVRRISRLKFENVVTSNILDDEIVIICADTVVVVGTEILGKPQNQEHCLEMLQLLSGKSHKVLTNVVMGRKNEPISTFCVETIVEFRKLKLDECQAYWHSGEPGDKAGGYGIQGLGVIFVESICGSYTNVVGLPLMETARALAGYGISVFTL